MVRRSRPSHFSRVFDAARGAGATIHRMIASLFAELAESDSLLANEIAVRSFEEHLALGLLLGLPHSHSERLLRQRAAAAPANVKRPRNSCAPMPASR